MLTAGATWLWNMLDRTTVDEAFLDRMFFETKTGLDGVSVPGIAELAANLF